jgi:hypothetical protein
MARIVYSLDLRFLLPRHRNKLGYAAAMQNNAFVLQWAPKKVHCIFTRRNRSSSLL